MGIGAEVTAPAVDAPAVGVVRGPTGRAVEVHKPVPWPVLSFTVWVPRRPRTPLFEVVGDSCSQTLITQRPGPVWVHRSGIGAALAANNNPIDAVEVRLGNGPSSGYSDKNRTAAGAARNSSARQQYSSDSIDVPSHTFGNGHGHVPTW